MMTPYEFFTDVCQFQTPELVQILGDATEVRHLKKGELLFRTGDNQLALPFLIRGLIRGFFLDIKGRDMTDCFGYRQGTAVAAFWGQLGAGGDSIMNVEVLEDSTFFCVPIPLILSLQERYLEVTLFYNRILTETLDEHWRLKQVLNQYTMTQRYKWFLEAYPELVNRVSSKNIASFLGMTEVTLSRIKKTMRQ